MTSLTNMNIDTVSAAGRPDLAKLAQMGAITIGPDGWPAGGAKNPTTGTREITVRIDGQKVQKIIPLQSGHAKNPSNPIWRAGLTPEKYHDKVMKEAEMQSTTGNRRLKVAPELQPEEAADYLAWLQGQGVSLPSNSVLQPIEDAKQEVLARTVEAAKKTAGRPKKVEVTQ